MTSILNSNDSSDKTYENPIGTDGFEFVEFITPNKKDLENIFVQLRFVPVAKHKSKDITLYQQGMIYLIINNDKTSYSASFLNKHGPSCPSMAFRVNDSNHAFEEALKRGAKPFEGTPLISGLKAIYGIGDSLLYFVDDKDRHLEKIPYSHDFEMIPGAAPLNSNDGLAYIDHLTHNVFTGRMDFWADFYERIFNFREIRYFDIDGKQTGLTSRALSSPCNKIRIPLNQSKDEKSQIIEYLKSYNGEGIQHIAFMCNDIYTKVEAFRKNGVPFLNVPDSYYDAVNRRVPEHGEDLERMKMNKILIDGSKREQEGLLLQLFTENLIGPIFFEIIERKGNQGFGEGNFTALFQAMEDDQVRRGVLESH